MNSDPGLPFPAEKRSLTECCRILVSNIEKRLHAIRPFYLGYAMVVLPQTATICALRSARTGLTRIFRASGACTSTDGLRLVGSLAVHPALAAQVEREVDDVLGNRRVEGPWFDVQGDDVGELEYLLGEQAYLDLVDTHVDKLMPVVPSIGLIEWYHAMDARIAAIEAWMLSNAPGDGPLQSFHHSAAGVTRFTFRPGRPPLAEHFPPHLAKLSGAPSLDEAFDDPR